MKFLVVWEIFAKITGRSKWPPWMFTLIKRSLVFPRLNDAPNIHQIAPLSNFQNLKLTRGSPSPLPRPLPTFPTFFWASSSIIGCFAPSIRASPSDFGPPVSKILDLPLLRYMKTGWRVGTAVREWNFRSFPGIRGAWNSKFQEDTALKQYTMAWYYILFNTLLVHTKQNYYNTYGIQIINEINIS